MALSTSTVTLSGYTITHHVSAVSESRGLVVYLDGDGMAKVGYGQSSDLTAMANAANAKGFTFVAPSSPYRTASGNPQWWDNGTLVPGNIARDYIDWAAGLYGADALYMVGYSGGATAVNKELTKVGTWPSKYVGGALSIGGGSTTNDVSTPAAWRPKWRMEYVVGSRDVAGATVPEWWSANDTAKATEAEFRAAGHPTKLTETGDDHKSYNFAGHVGAFLPAKPAAPTPTAMTLAAVSKQVNDWVASIKGRFVDEDGAYGAQCKDLISHYIRVVHAEPYTKGNGDQMADALISEHGWVRVSTSSTWQVGDVVSVDTSAYGGHVFVILSDDGTRISYVDLNGGPDPANSGPDEAVVVRSSSKSSWNVVAVARPPAYVGATGSVSDPTPTPTVKPATTILAEGGLSNARAIVDGAKAAGVPLHIAAAFVEQESNGKNVYGHDLRGIYDTTFGPVTVDGVTYPKGANVPVSRTSYRAFLDMLLYPATGTRAKRPNVISNGVGPMQITYWGYHWEARAAGIDLSDPAQNIRYGMQLVAGHLKGDFSRTSIEKAGTIYNAGSLANGVNSYGIKVADKAEKWKAALAGATVTVPDPETGEDETVPLDPIVGPEPAPAPVGPPAAGGEIIALPELGDPGARPQLASFQEAEVTPMPTILPGPLVDDTPLLSEPMARVHLRGQWWYPVSWNVVWEQGIPGPDQSPGGSGMVAAEGEVTVTRPVPLLQRHGWNPWRDNPPTYGEPVLIEVSMDGGRNFRRIFTGIVDQSRGSVGNMLLSFTVVEDVDGMDAHMAVRPKNFRMPSPRDGHRYMSIGLHAASCTAEWAADAGYRATPQWIYPATIMSAPMLGTMWPEIGTLEDCQTVVAKSATATSTPDYPDITRTWWGLTVGNVWARYQPTFFPGASGRMDQDKAIRCFVAPVQDGPAFVELWWGTASIVVTVDWRGVTVETQDGYLENGWRKVLYGRTRALTDAQKASGFDLIVWLGRDKSLHILVDGDESSHAVLPSYPRQMNTAEMSQVRITTRPGHTQIGAVQVYSTNDRTVVKPFKRNLVLDVDPGDVLFGVPAITDRAIIDLLREQSERLLVTTYLDELGRLWSVSRGRMDSRASVRTLTEADIAADPEPRWGIGRASVYAHIHGKWLQPAASQTRMSSAAATNVWEGPNDELRPGETWETVASAPADVDWIDPDTGFTKASLENVGRINQGAGSILGGRTRQSDSDGKVTEGVPSVTWFNGEASRIDWKNWAVEVRYTPPASVKALFQMSTFPFDGLSSAVAEKGIILRARARQVWKQFTTPRAKQTGADDSISGWRSHTHDGGWHIQSPAVMDKVLTRLGQMYAQPLPAHDEVRLVTPDPAITRASTITLSLDAYQTPQRVTAIRWEGGPDGVRQTLGLRQIHP